MVGAEVEALCIILLHGMQELHRHVIEAEAKGVETRVVIGS